MKAKPRSPEEWREIFNEYEASGWSHQAFAEHKGIKLSTFRAWKYRLSQKENKPRFVEVQAPGSNSRNTCALMIRHGQSKLCFREVPKPEYLCELLQTLEGRR